MQTPAARNSDPITSHMAADYIQESGIKAAQQNIALMTVHLHPGHTSNELTRYCGLDRYQLGKRLPELRKAGFLVNGKERKCTVSGRLAITWYTTEEIERQARG